MNIQQTTHWHNSEIKTPTNYAQSSSKRIKDSNIKLHELLTKKMQTYCHCHRLIASTGYIFERNPEKLSIKLIYSTSENEQEGFQ